jgi:hypothetical protein
MISGESREVHSRMNALRASNLSMNSHKGVPSRNKMQQSMIEFKINESSLNEGSSMIIVGNNN